ncbi:ImmA/IrrE family metallo-endopeptidase [Streptococcus infantis]|uniref:ImmA/IrrE family metallo-endopeptidase n=1 Tax=Streptococcus infantis TaxID=68892 RepID=UPI001F158150|nr:ImmA/IrrE family metallo-endopeptidase [Streptococcus infantis]UJD04309.1 ImmA/IrrE family metallo-endopeptidase [Streptococcus infantis]
MDELYLRISSITKQRLYQYMKDNNIPLLKYHFNLFFYHCVKMNKIQVISHHFTNHKIEGLTIMDEYGISFSYEKDNPKVKQNFTLCHELGHFVLNHNGTCFTESVENQESLLEREANIFSALVLMPDIVLLSKIYYSCDSFQEVQESLEVSKQALYFRLIDLLRVYFPNGEVKIKHAVNDYLETNNSSIRSLFHEIKQQLIDEFNQYSASLKVQTQNRIFEQGFVSSQELPELIDQNNWKELRESIDNLKIWLIYNKGKSVAYAWDSTKISDQEARRKAELQLLLMQ